ncbi:MAG TPA: sulfite exporter TauE/SafE family protein [Actinomycetales bacterium]|nr:sulfite exporter TauE/SafE family protein [Actinomycetales bacterium]
MGIGIGLSLGALGAGGSVLTVPALVYGLGQAPEAAMAASLVVVALMSVTGLSVHWRADRVCLRHGILLGMLGTVGSYLGSRLAMALPDSVLLTAFGVLVLLIAVLMVTRTSSRSLGKPPQREQLGVNALRGSGIHAWFTLAKILAAAGAIGVLTGLFGIGGGFLVVPVLTLMFRFPVGLAVGTSLLVILVNCITGLTFRLWLGASVDWAVIAPFALFAAAGSYAGSRLASRIDASRLSTAFVLLLLAVGAYTLAQNVSLLV